MVVIPFVYMCQHVSCLQRRIQNIQYLQQELVWPARIGFVNSFDAQHS